VPIIVRYRKHYCEPAEEYKWMIGCPSKACPPSVSTAPLLQWELCPRQAKSEPYHSFNTSTSIMSTSTISHKRVGGRWVYRSSEQLQQKLCPRTYFISFHKTNQKQFLALACWCLDRKLPHWWWFRYKFCVKGTGYKNFSIFFFFIFERKKGPENFKRKHYMSFTMRRKQMKLITDTIKANTN
jgi:hypothetical protein